MLVHRRFPYLSSLDVQAQGLTEKLRLRAVLLACHLFSYVTGTLLFVDGGYTAM